MRALMYYGANDIRLEDIPEPACRPGCVKLKPEYVGICGSDVHLYCHETVALSTVKPGVTHPVSQEQLPIVFGHEFGGVVAEVGEGVTRASVGDRVAVRPSIFDRTCNACLEGSPNVCQNYGFLGIHGSGGLADFVVADQHAVFRVPEGLDPEVGALVEPLAVGWHASRLAGEVNASSTALIVGGGPIGCAVFLALIAQGAKRIVVSEVSEPRRDLLRRLGAQHVFSPAETDIVGKVKDLSDGQGAHVAFDCAGLPATIATAVAAIRARGVIVNVALWAVPAPVDLMVLMGRDVTLRSSLSYTDIDFEEVLAAMGSGGLEPRAMITRKIALPELMDKGLRALSQAGHADCKVLVDMQLGT